MNENILSMLQSYLTPDVIEKASSFIGEDSNKVTNAVGGILPTLLSGLISKASSNEGASGLFNLMSDLNLSDGGGLLSNISNLSNLFSSGETSQNAVKSGGSILNFLFGNKLSSVIDIITSVSGLRKGSASTMLSMLAPLVLGFLGKQSGGSLSSLVSLLMGQKSFVANAAPAGLASILGLSSFADWGGKTTTSGSTKSTAYQTQDTKKTVVSNVEEESSSSGSPFKWLLPLLLLGLLGLGFYFMKGCGADASKIAENASNTVNTTVDAAKDAANTAANTATDAANTAVEATKNAAQAVGDATMKSVEALGGLFKRKLAGGVELNIPKNGVENNLITFIEDKSKKVDKTTWFSFDRLLFETGKSSLKPESQEQLNNMAAIMKAYPGVEIKLGGYTDNTGDAAKNLKLSQDRANTVMAELVKLGVAAARMKAEGYGQDHPVASNDTPEGRAQNRRIEIRVTKK